MLYDAAPKIIKVIMLQSMPHFWQPLYNSLLAKNVAHLLVILALRYFGHYYL